MVGPTSQVGDRGEPHARRGHIVRQGRCGGVLQAQQRAWLAARARRARHARAAAGNEQHAGGRVGGHRARQRIRGDRVLVRELSPR